MTKNEFLNTFESIVASSYTADTATFENINTIYLSEKYQTTTTNSLFFINGVHIYSESIISVQNSGNNLIVTFNTSSIGHTLEATDEITAHGKFVLI